MVPKHLKIKCSAPGKIILHGEHSVVYGKLAIAASLDLRTTVTIEERVNNKIDINFIDLGFKRYIHLHQIKQVFAATDIPIIDNFEDENASLDNIFLFPDILDHDRFIEKIRTCLNLQENTLDKNKYSSLISFLYLYFGIIYSSKIPIEAICVTIKTELSLGSGTGSSASLMVSLASAFIQYLVTKSPSLRPKFEIDDSKPYDQFNELQLKLISKWGFAAERIIHGNPSGIDNTVCTYGSIVSFRKGRAPFAVKCNREIKGLLVDTKVPKNTAIQVQKVADLKQRRPKIVECVLEAMEHLTEEALDLLIQLGDDSIVNASEFNTERWYMQLGELSSLNHNLLRTLGVSHPALDKTVDLMSRKKLHGKLTGAGGGGYVIALISPELDPKDLTELCLDLNSQGFKTMVTNLGGFGTRFED